MTKADLQSLTGAQLAEGFVAICVQDFDAIMDCDAARQNRCITALVATERELKSRDDNPLRHLLPYITHPNIVVRLQVARAVIPIATEKAIAVLKVIAQSKLFPPMLDAEDLLEKIEKGER